MIYTIIGFAATFVLSVVLGPFVIKFMKNRSVKNVQRDFLAQDNNVKGKTPSMGGFLFMIPVVLVSIAMGIIKHDNIYFVLTGLVVAHSVLGFLDDYLKVKKHSIDGLKWYEKMAGQLLVSIGFALYLQYFTDYSNLSIRFLGVNYDFSFGWAYIPFVVFLMVAESNGVNITDGLDGLVSGTSAIVLIFFIVAGITMFNNDVVVTYSAIFLGGILAFLIFNFKPAKIFMGDVGSLALGAAVGAISLISGHPFVILYVGLIFALEIIADVLQVGSYKIRHKKRIIPTAPLHHSFQDVGWSEWRIVLTFWGVTALLAVGTYFVMK